MIKLVQVNHSKFFLVLDDSYRSYVHIKGLRPIYLDIFEYKYVYGSIKRLLEG